MNTCAFIIMRLWRLHSKTNSWVNPNFFYILLIFSIRTDLQIKIEIDYIERQVYKATKTENGVVFSRTTHQKIKKEVRQENRKQSHLKFLNFWIVKKKIDLLSYSMR